jgi:DNA-binding NarL/FixJ family response regulator
MTATKITRVLLVDDHPIVRQGLKLLIDGEDDMEVNAEASTAAEAMQLLARELPDIALIDISLEDRSGVELIKDILARFPGLPLLALSMHDESLYAERVLRAGGKGYIMKQEATEVMLAAIRKVLAGEIYLSPKMSTRLLNHFVNRKSDQQANSISRLTDRELEIFTMIGRGLSTREIADKLFLSIKTVEAHREHIKEKLNLKSWVELVRHAVQFSLDQGG